MKKLVLSAALGIALSACGGGGGISWKDPDSFDPAFGPASSTLTSGEDAAWQGGAAALGAAPALVDATDAVAADAGGTSLANLPNQMQAAFGDEYQTAALRAEESAVTAQGLALLAGAPALTATPFWDNFETCWTMTATRIRYSGCRRTVTQDGNTSTTTLDGTITREAGLVTWDATLGLSATTAIMSVSTTDRLRGDVAFSTVDGTFAGKSRSDIDQRMSVPLVGYTAEVAVTFSADYALDYAVDPFCITGGTLTAKRVWSMRPPANAPGTAPDPNPGLTDAAVQFTWLGCGSVQVARSLQ